MRAITVLPGARNSLRLDDIAEPPASDGAILVRSRALGVCGTDREIVEGLYGEAPAGAERLVLGHESLGEVMQAPRDSGFAPGDLIVGIVRRPDPVPCPACAIGEWDMCRNGRYTERGIKARNGFGSERFRIEPEFALKVDRSLGLVGVLMEPTTIVAKAWDHALRIGARTRSWHPRRLLVTGAGPIGLLAALLGAQRGCELHMLDRSFSDPKPRLVRGLGGTTHCDLEEALAVGPDVVMECTGAPAVVEAVMTRAPPASVVCLLGLGPDRRIDFDIGRFNQTAVLQNHVVFGAVNANRHHYEMAADALARAERGWLELMISRRVPLASAAEALERRPGDIKVVIDFTL